MQDFHWRFLDTGFGDAYTNMAIDEVLARAADTKNIKPTLRLYGWKPYAISLGYNQKLEDIDLEKCTRDGIDVVRRPTGGRAILHAEEVTYSVVIPRTCTFFYKDILTTYNLISQALVAGLKNLGIEPALEKRAMEGGDRSTRNPLSVPCFSSSARYEIVYQGRKLVGSAQRRYDRAILQHGSILLGDYHLKLCEYLSATKTSNLERIKKYFAEKTISISQLLNRKITYEKVVQSLKKGFADKYGICFFEDQLTPREMEGVNRLKPKYQNLRR